MTPLKVRVILSILMIFVVEICCQRDAVPSEGYQEPGHGSTKKFYKLGEFNDKCKMTRDCRHFGYVCRDNKTCQCDFMYIPDANKKTCVGGVNQRCIYDEHCIEGAFCMNQAVCKCKDNSPFESDDGLLCAGAAVAELSIDCLHFMVSCLFYDLIKKYILI